ncbi:cytochrome P450 [Nocardia sp. BMG51109]|uniref:cytochrome P450 n=1 Tax=Nocardia sp. BMG51109 TaxID=1056816 RepID=UPI0004670D41|nr:cytochrome P450 [Nocardia sp. BMG51109]
MASASTIPRAPGRVPVLGHAVPLLTAPLDFLESLPEHGDLVEVRIGPATAIVVCDPASTRRVLRDDRTFDKGGPLFDRAREVLGNGLASCPYDMHRRQRRLVQPAFRPARLARYADAMTARIAELTESWCGGQTVDVVPEMQALTARVTVETMFADSLEPAELRAALDDLTTIATGWYRRMFQPSALRRLPSRGSRRYRRANARLRGLVDRLVADRRAAGVDSGGLESGGLESGDLLSALLSARDPEGDGGGLTDAEIADQIMTFFIGGTETTANVLAWALYALGRHPDIADRVADEADAVLAGRPARHPDLPRLPVTGRVITETMRLWPPAWMITRTTRTRTQLGGYPIEPGTTVVFSPYLLHRRPGAYPDPERFDPDRWSPDRPSSVPREAFIPFGDGARRCLGDNFGKTEAALTLATIAGRWRLEPISGTHVRPAIGTFMSPRGLRMRAVARHGCRGAGLIRKIDGAR